LLALAPAAPLLAQETRNPYSTDLPQYAHLQALEDRAIDLQENGPQDAEGKAQTVAAWQALQEAAQRTLLADGAVHPLAHITKIAIASHLYRQGEIDAALVEAEDGVAGALPYLEAYPAKMAEGAALIGLLLTHKGETERAFAMVEETYAYFLRLDPEGQDESFSIAKSNLEFTLSQTALRLGQTQEALDYQKASLDSREGALGPNHPDTVSGYYSYAQTLRRAGRMEEAEGFARTAVDRASAHVDPSHPSYARAFEMLGIILANSGRPIEGSQFLTRALELKREHEGADTLVFGYGIHNLATLLLERQQYEEAQPLFTEAETIMARYQGPASAFPILALAYNGQASLALGDPAEAVRLLAEGRNRLGENTGDVEALGRIAPDLVHARILVGDRDGALTVARQFENAVRASDTTDTFELALATLLRAYAQPPEQATATDMRIPAARNVISATRRFVTLGEGAALPVRYLAAIDLVMEIAAQQNDADLMLSAMALVSEANLTRVTSRRAAQLQADNPDLAAALRDLEEASQRLDRADSALLLALAQGEDAKAQRQEFGQAKSASEAIEQALQQRFPQWAAARLTPEPSITQLQSLLGDDEAVLAVTPIYYGTYALLVTPDGARAIQLSATRHDVVALANALGSSVRVESFDTDSSLKLGEALFPAEIMADLAETQSLRIYANGPLASLPFSLLQGWGGAGEQRWLLDRFSLSYLSDLSGWEHEEANGSDDPLDLVAFAAPSPFSSPASGAVSPTGAPSQIADYFARSGIDVSALAGLLPLPGTDEEVRSIAASVPWRSQRLFIGAEANEQAMRQSETRLADIVVLATHGIVAGEIEGIAEPALVLSPGEAAKDDGVLTASEIAQLDMRAQWVILSSCDSAAGMQGGLPAFSGLAQAFRQAGAKDLLVSHWKVRDDVAAYVSSQTVLNYRTGMSKTEALRDAIRKLRKESGIVGADSPFAWAPFVLITG